MQTTTAAFDAAAVANVRNPVARIKMVWSGPTVDTGITYSASGENNVSDTSHITNSINNPSANWFLLDGNSTLDGSTFGLFPTPSQDEYEVGWYGDTFSDGSGNFASAQTMQVNFATKAVFGVYLVGDSIKGEYPVAFTIQIRTGTTVHDTITETTNTEMYYQGVTTVTSADNILLSITKWSEPNAVVKIIEFYSSITRWYYGDVIKSISILEEREIRDSTNPIGNISANECTIELQNIFVDELVDPFFPGNELSFYHTMLKPGRQVFVELGFETSYGVYEYVPMGTFWTGDFTIKESSATISFTARDRMEHLRKLIYEDNVLDTNIDFDDFIESIILSAQNKETGLTYSIDTALSSYAIPISYMPRLDYFEAIRQSVAAVGGQAFMNRDDELIIESSAEAWYYTTPDLFITKSEYFDKDQPSRYEELINKVEIETQPLEAQTPDSVYDSDDIALTASEVKTIEINYNTVPVSGVTDSDVTLTGTGCTPTLTDSDYYSWGCILEITETAATTGTFTIQIDGTFYNIIGSEVVSAVHNNSILENGEKSYTLPKNHLLQDADDCQTIANNLIDIYSDPRNDLTITWRGNPALELGDTIVAPEYQRGAQNNRAVFKIYKIQTSFDGTLKQTLSGRRVETYT